MISCRFLEVEDIMDYWECPDESNLVSTCRSVTLILYLLHFNSERLECEASGCSRGRLG